MKCVFMLFTGRSAVSRSHSSLVFLARARARPSSRSHELSMVILGLNNTVKKRLYLGAKALANWLNSSVFGAGKQSHTRTPHYAPPPPQYGSP